jgi:Na+-translocating ferredoxin:NAD+ oxidoreductase subunit C
MESLRTVIDYSKFRLKPPEEIIAALEGVDNILIVGCNRCFKEFTEIENPQCGELMKILAEANKKILGCVDLEFLCNRVLTGKALKGSKKAADCSAVLVNSCGIGVQTVAALLDKPVYTASNSISHGGHHDMSLSVERCRACAGCVLSFTGGICPVVNCTKELLNGPCGGAKNGKCEIDPEKDCGWEKIVIRLRELDKTALAGQFTKVRDYAKPGFKKTNSYSVSLREKRAKGFYGGVYPLENKDITKDMKISAGPEPKVVVIPLSQHTGTICEPLVKAGDRVKAGQKIADSKSFISAPVHSSVSGRVTGIECRYHPLVKSEIESIIIESDCRNEMHESVRPRADWESMSAEAITDIIRESGIVGLGGAQFPTHVKLKSKKPIDSFILNGCECEPFLTSDNRVMAEKAGKVVLGMKILMKILGVKNGYVAIEDNKPEALEAIKAIVDNETIKVVQLETKYPQGAERMLIKKVLDRAVPAGGLPLDVGVVVNNVSTAVAVSEAVTEGLPLIKRVVTVTGDRVAKPGNYEVKIGTSLKELLDFCGAKIDDKTIVRAGGPMMGILQGNLDAPVIKGMSGILAYTAPDIELDLSRACIKCGRCVDVCPVELLPLYYGFHAEKEQWKEMEKHGVLNCIECGCCDYICPMKRSMVASVKKAKAELRKAQSLK